MFGLRLSNEKAQLAIFQDITTTQLDHFFKRLIVCREQTMIC